MRVEVNIKRAEQSWDLDSGVQQNYLVVDVFGVEVYAPCTEAQLAEVIANLHGGGGGAEVPEGFDVDEEERRAAPSTFVEDGPEPPLPPPARPPPAQPAPMQPTAASPAPRRLAPMQRPRGDDVGIAQG